MIDTLARIFKIIREAYDPSIPISKDFSRKTAELVQKHTQSGKIKDSLEVYEINENTLKIIEDKHASDSEKIYNLLKSIEKDVIENCMRELHLISIGEKAELIAKLYQERQRNTQETLDALKNIIDEINIARKEQAEKKMPNEVFSIYWLFKREGIIEPENKANQMIDVLDKYPYWRTSEAHEREIRQNLYKILLKDNKKDVNKIAEFVSSILRIIKGNSI